MNEDYKRLSIRPKHLFQVINASLKANGMTRKANPQIFPFVFVGYICEKVICYTNLLIHVSFARHLIPCKQFLFNLPFFFFLISHLADVG